MEKKQVQKQDNKTIQQQQGAPQKQKESPFKVLEKVGGFNLLESVVEGVANMNPSRKARKEIFLNDQNKKTEREDLKSKLKLWIDLLEGQDRKSTRLNSSHVRISYAVFCL